MKRALILSVMFGFAVVGMLKTFQIPQATDKLAWWGVMYPNFCITDVIKGTTADKITDVHIKSRILEWLERA